MTASSEWPKAIWVDTQSRQNTGGPVELLTLRQVVQIAILMGQFLRPIREEPQLSQWIEGAFGTDLELTLTTVRLCGCDQGGLHFQCKYNLGAPDPAGNQQQNYVRISTV